MRRASRKNSVASRTAQKHGHHLIALVLLLVGFHTDGNAQETYYYKGRPYGSEAMYNPFYLILNGSYDIIQLDGRKRDIFQYPYSISVTNVMRNLTDPFGPISRYGLGNFIKREILPLTYNISGAQWWPNYQLHLIGGGMTYVAIKEWYEAHNFSSPVLWSLATMTAYHLLNEFVENGPYVGDNVDPIADIYFFDIPGILLFSFDGINRFFSNDLHLADWSLQPSLAPSNWTLQNNGQYFSIKWKFPFSEKWHAFYYFGLRGLLGVSYKMEDGSAISFGAGMRAKRLKTVEQATNTKTVELNWNAGVFYDKENSLMASLFLSESSDNAVSLNIYPGIFSFGEFSPGAWFLYSRDSGLLFGFTTMWAPGIAITQK